MTQQSHIPGILQVGLLTPILKKNKDPKLPGNYRGITVNPVINKLLECLLQEQIDDILNPTQNRLQRGFSKKTNPLNAGLLITEGINEALDAGNTIAIITLDAEKAFDKVDHQHLMRKLFYSGINDNIWQLIKALQTEALTKVKWKGNVTSEFPSLQGIRQGAKLSPVLYKRYNNQLLDTLERHCAGARIGTTYIGAPTVADDVAIIADNPVDLQCALHIVSNCTQADRVTINSTKSDAVICNSTKNREAQTWILGKDEIEEVDRTTHIGLTRQSNKKNAVNERIQKGRRTLYALMGAGLHGKNGLNPIVSYKLYTTYSRPRITYGLEVTQLHSFEKTELETFERKLLKNIQGLPDRCANIAAYILLGATPISIQIERQSLTVFHKIASNPEFIEYDIATRQLAMKDNTSHSWFIYIKYLLEKYSLPSAYEIMTDPPKKAVWKDMLDRAIDSYVSQEWEQEKNTKPSLRYLNIQPTPTKNPHPIWGKTGSDPRAVSMATIKARVLTGTYTLQSNRKKFNQHQVSDTCLLCKQEAENRTHFILLCTTLQQKRQKHLSALRQLLASTIGVEASDEIFNDQNKLLQCILDCTHPDVGLLEGNSDIVHSLEAISRNLIYELHTARAVSIQCI